MSADQQPDANLRQLFIERYKSDRAHEMELEKFSGALERSFLQASAILNGGSATVFLSFIGSTLGKTNLSPCLVVITFLLWVIGLGCAVGSGLIAYEAQNGFRRSVRSKRHVSGLKVLGNEYRKTMMLSDSDTLETLQKEVEDKQRSAEDSWRRAKNTGFVSVASFGIGALFALATVLTAAPVPHAP